GAHQVVLELRRLIQGVEGMLAGNRHCRGGYVIHPKLLNPTTGPKPRAPVFRETRCPANARVSARDSRARWRDTPTRRCDRWRDCHTPWCGTPRPSFLRRRGSSAPCERSRSRTHTAHRTHPGGGTRPPRTAVVPRLP